MEIEGLDDFEWDRPLVFPKLWNGRGVEWKAHLRAALHEKIQSQRFSGTPLRGRCTQDLAGAKESNNETFIKPTYVVSGSISIKDFLDPGYLDLEIQIVPWQVSIWENMPFIELPEGVSPEIFMSTAPFILPPLSLDLYPSTFGLCPQYFSSYQSYVSEEYIKAILPTAEFAHAALSAAQINPLEPQLADISVRLAIEAAGSVEQAKLTAQLIAQAKTASAEALRKTTAFDLFQVEMRYKNPPPVPPRGFARVPYDIVFKEWLEEKRQAEAVVAAQIQNAAKALEEAVVATANVAALTKAATTASEQAKLAAAAADQAQAVIAAPLLTPPQFIELPEIPPPLPPLLHIEPVVTLSPGEQFASFITQKIQEAKDPNYIDTVPKPPEWNSCDEAVALIASKIEAAKDPNYINTVPKSPELNSCDEAMKLIASKIEQAKDSSEILIQIQDPSYWITMESVQRMFRPLEGIPEIAANNYASKLACSKPAAPFFEVPLLGFKDQCTIHFHCGIKNNFSSVVGGGIKLYKSLDRGFAVQPHLVHSNYILEGLILVGIEKIDNVAEKKIASGGLLRYLPQEFELTSGTPQSRASIDYEVQSLRQIAQNIIATGNPNLKQVHVTFSNGGCLFENALKQLTPEERNTIIVITTGTTQIIKSDLACEVYNVIGSKDWPSQICNGGLSGIEEARENGAQVEVIPQDETQTGIGGHYFIQSDYQKRIQELIKETIKGKYEIY